MILNANALELPIKSGSVHCVVTSPPYWGLRDYGVEGQLGLERTPEAYVENMVRVFREVWRVLRDDGTLWLNLGDTYNSGAEVGRHGGLGATGIIAAPRQYGTRAATGLKPKDLVGIPWRVAFALQADGWYLRSDIVWSKPNPMPESVTDRPTKSHEYLFLLSKRPTYYYDAEAIREAATDEEYRTNGKIRPSLDAHYLADPAKGRTKAGLSNQVGARLTRNRRTVWEIATQPYAEAHFATFPEALVEPCVLAGTSERGACAACGAPWARVVEKSGGTTGKGWHDHSADLVNGQRKNESGMDTYRVETKGWQPTCACAAPTAQPLVLDPFAGSGTVGQVCHRLGRRFIGTELKPDYCRLAFERTAQMGLI